MNLINRRQKYQLLGRLFGMLSVLGLYGGQVWADIDFEAPTYSLSDISTPSAVINPLVGQDGWVGGSSGPENAVVATATSGLYVGGQAAGHIDSGGIERVGRLGQTPAVGNTMQADFFGTDQDGDGFADSNVRMHGWVDINNDGIYDGASGAGERGFLFGLDSVSAVAGRYSIEFANSTSEITSADPNQSGATWSLDTWYRITASWVDNGVDMNDVTISVFDLTNNADLGTVITATLTDAEFGFDPATYEGVAFRSTRGLVDNILSVPEPCSIVLLSLGLLGTANCRSRKR